jgi:hypothetical protein
VGVGRFERDGTGLPGGSAPEEEVVVTCGAGDPALEGGWLTGLGTVATGCPGAGPQLTPGIFE